ncbi:MAG: DUF421 domain-containing protein [Pseudolabrys sp.]|nr:DUF421 domain-containing protein [Pseudolabrys sp.]
MVIVIGSISSRAISGTAPFFASLAGTFILIAGHWVVSFFARDSKFLSWLVMGRDSVVIRAGRVDKQALRREHMSDDDLAEDLRQQSIESASEVKSARLERSGKLSVIKFK